MKKKVIVMAKTNFFYVNSIKHLKKHFNLKVVHMKYPLHNFKERESHYLAQKREIKMIEYENKGYVSDKNEITIKEWLIEEYEIEINEFNPDAVIIERGPAKGEEILLETIEKIYPVAMLDKEQSILFGDKPYIEGITELCNKKTRGLPRA